MKYTKEQKEKILNYVAKKAAEGVMSESLEQLAANGNISVVYAVTYGKSSADSAILKFVGDSSLNDTSIGSLAENYKNYRAVIRLPKWELTWTTDTPEDNLEVIDMLSKIDTGMSLKDYLTNGAKKEQQKTLIEKFFEEN